MVGLLKWREFNMENNNFLFKFTVTAWDEINNNGMCYKDPLTLEIRSAINHCMFEIVQGVLLFYYLFMILSAFDPSPMSLGPDGSPMSLGPDGSYSLYP